MSERRALTLIELLVVITIIGLLAGLILAASGVVLRLAKKAECQSLLAKVEAAIGQFADRHRAIPMATWGSDPGAPEPADEWSNRLFWRLGTPMTRADRAAAEALVPAAVAAVPPATPAEADVYRGGFSDFPPWRVWTGGGAPFQGAVMDLIGVVRGEAAATRVLRAHQTSELITIGDIGKKYLAKSDPLDAEPSVIVDPWGQPLVYVSLFEPAVPARSISHLPGWNKGTHGTEKVGLPPAGRATITDDNGNGSIGDEVATSDIRLHAFPGFELRYELWSAGPDGRFNAIRGHEDNDDNITITDYRHDGTP